MIAGIRHSRPLMEFVKLLAHRFLTLNVRLLKSEGHQVTL